MKFKYKLQDSVFHCTPESLKGIIIKRRYYPDEDVKEYLVTYGWVDSAWCVEEELVAERILDI